MEQPEFIPGQRWVSDNDPGLGLGVVLGSSGRMVEILFPACSEKRTYAWEDAPLTRVAFSPGDRVEDQQGQQLTVVAVSQQDGLLVYRTADDKHRGSTLHEQQLSYFLQFSQPQQRLFSAQLDEPHWFDLRFDTLEHDQRLQRSSTRGLAGVRTALLPHQLYIAHEVSRRAAPRVLLADEVGLGKTIEAGLILHHRLLTGQASRALVLVPGPLLNQWLVELLRRFNLHFSLYDEARCEAIDTPDRQENPFLAEQQVLTSLDLFVDRPRRMDQAAEAGWDMLIVDEAHHLEWSEQRASAAYQVVERLATSIPGVLLLTATPEQLGRSGHFARLRLLDPDRFHSLSAFEQEARGFQTVADAVDQLLADEQLSAAARATLHALRVSEEGAELIARSSGPEGPDREHARQELIGQLLDRHGTGRVLYRNSRAQVQGFPGRELHAFPLPLPEEYLAVLDELAPPPALRLTPETLDRGFTARPWWEIDPRLDWLVWRLRSLDGEKVLLICASGATAVELATALRTREGIHAGVFHENTSIIERDRAAAWFADPDAGCPLLICSEIGSEGRNFQFARHLVLFDLPLDPDLLEQRIGRLDRIGQHRVIQIHVPYFEDSAQAIMLRWYDQGLNGFRTTCPAGQSLFRRLQPALMEMLESPAEEPKAMEALIDEARRLNSEIGETLRKGRDRLLEYNSCREPQASALKHAIESEPGESRVQDYMERVFSAYGVETEEHSSRSLIIRGGPQMLCEGFPGLPEEGITATFERESALVHEDRQFLTWEHPMVIGAMEMISEGNAGSSCVSAVHHPDISAGGMLLELLLAIESPAPRRLAIGRFLPATLLRLVIDQRLAECSESISREGLVAARVPLEPAAARRLAVSLRAPVERMLTEGWRLAEAGLPEHLVSARRTAHSSYRNDITRLEALSRINPNIRKQEIAALREQERELARHLDAAKLRLDALHLVIGL